MRVPICAWSLVFVAAGAGAAWGDALQACRAERDPAQRMRACSAVIADRGAAAEQKAAALRIRGRTRFEAGALTDALEDLDAALGLRADDAAALAVRGQIHLARNDQARALADFDAALRRDGRNAEILVLRGHAHLVAGRSEAAIADFSAALALKPDAASAFNNRALAYRKSGDVERAIADYTSAIALNPLYALAFNNRGYAFEAKGDKARAIADFQRALAIDPSLAGAKSGLARLGVTVGADEASAHVRAGKALVEKTCGWCHATGLAGASANAKAPAFRHLRSRHPMVDLREPLTRGIAAPHDQMPHFSFDERELDQIVAYINSLEHARAP